jgi:hypothetical protein
MRILLSIILISSCLYSCQDPTKVVDQSMQENNINMKTDYKNSYDTLKLQYQERIKEIKNIDSLQTLNIFYSIIKENLFYIDSLKIEMDKLDQSDPKEVEGVKNIFITNGIADSLFDKLKLSYIMAESISSINNKDEIKRSRANILNELDIKKK